jgi:hypothetical protein
MPRVKMTRTTKVLLWGLQFYLVVLLVLILVRFLHAIR